MTLSLPQPARYTPWLSGTYSVAPGLRPLGTDFGNGRADGLLFQLDAEFPRYRKNKLAAREERLSKYYARQQLPPEVESATTTLFAERLRSEHPELFQGDLQTGLHCHLTGDVLSAASPAGYEDLVEALCCQVQEDVAIVVRRDGREWLAMLHVCAPSRWSPEEKIGHSFGPVHQPVPGFEKVAAGAAGLVEASIHRGPWTRFVWGVEVEHRLNLHPDPPRGAQAVAREPEDYATRPLYLRTERQVIWGLPSVEAFLFTIRVQSVSWDELCERPDWIAPLRQSLEGMTAASLEYKGMSLAARDAVLARLAS